MFAYSTPEQSDEIHEKLHDNNSDLDQRLIKILEEADSVLENINVFYLIYKNIL